MISTSLLTFWRLLASNCDLSIILIATCNKQTNTSFIICQTIDFNKIICVTFLIVVCKINSLHCIQTSPYYCFFSIPNYSPNKILGKYQQSVLKTVLIKVKSSQLFGADIILPTFKVMIYNNNLPPHRLVILIIYPVSCLLRFPHCNIISKVGITIGIKK